MKRLLLSATVLAMASTAAFADGLTTLGLDDPEVMAPPSVSGDWTGPYVGLSYGRTTTTTATYEEWARRMCDYTAPSPLNTEDNHMPNKCGVSELDFSSSPEIAALDTVEQWPDDDAGWDNSFPYGASKVLFRDDLIWVGNQDFEYTTADLDETSGGPRRIDDNAAYNRFLGTFQKMVGTTSETTEDFGAFLGYRHDFGRIVGGAEIGVNGDLRTLEGQVGLDLGKVLTYAFAGVGDLDGVSGKTYGIGADMALGKNLLVGVKTTRGEFGDTDLDSTLVRVAIQF